MKKERGKIPIIRLDDEGALLQCQEGFLALVPDRKNGKFGPGANINVVEVAEDDFVMFLGVRHFKSKKNEMMEKAVGELPPWTNEIWRNRLSAELFRGPYYTSLHFLWKEKIVKVDWHGKWGLDQLTEASNFMYRHFLVPESMRRKVG